MGWGADVGKVEDAGWRKPGNRKFCGGRWG